MATRKSVFFNSRFAFSILQLPFYTIFLYSSLYAEPKDYCGVDVGGNSHGGVVDDGDGNGNGNGIDDGSCGNEEDDDGDDDDDDDDDDDGSDDDGSDDDDDNDDDNDDDDKGTKSDKHRKRQPTITVEGSNRYVKVLETMGMYKYFNQIIKGEIRMNSASNSRAIVDRVACFLAHTFGFDQPITSEFVIKCMKRIAIKKHNSINAYCQKLLNQGYAPSKYNYILHTFIYPLIMCPRNNP